MIDWHLICHNCGRETIVTMECWLYGQHWQRALQHDCLPVELFIAPPHVLEQLRNVDPDQMPKWKTGNE